MKKFLKIFAIVIVVFGLMQLIPIDRTNPPVNKAQNFVDVQKTPANISMVLKNACYDCHSNETKYPDYSYVAPISWSVKNHINEGRKRLNFSVWTTYSQELKVGMLKNTISTVTNRKMPIPGYMVYHEEANITQAERKLLENYFKKILEEKSY